jgi:hypothetical protein
VEYEKLTYTNELGDSLEFSTSSVYFCNVSKDATGLAGVDNKIYSTNSAQQHGDTFTGQRIEARDITVKGAINTRDKARAIELRRKALRILNPELKGELKYEYQGFTKVIEVRIDDKPDFYKKKVLLEYDIAFKALNPFWQDETETKEEIASWVGAWEFPTEIDEDSADSMVFGYREESVIVDCYNAGDVSTGMRIKFTALGVLENPMLLNVKTGEFIQINRTMQAGDVITVNTEYGNKGAALERNGEVIDCFKDIDVDSIFMTLGIGDNIYRYDAASGVDNLEVSIYYNPQYLGV